MQIDSLKRFLFEKIKLSIIRGDITGTPKLPTDKEIESEIDKSMNSSANGIIGSMTSLVPKSISSSKDYSGNFLTIKDNIEYLLGEVFASMNSIIDIVNDSVLEKNQVLRDLKLMDVDFSDVEAGTLHNDGLKYVISDNFADISKVDSLRTTAQINLNAGSVSLNSLRSSYLSFNQYRNKTNTQFTITEGFSSVVSQQQTPGTRFGNIFLAGDDTNRWELIVNTSKNVNIEGYFTLQLSDIGDTIDINSIIMKLYGVKSISENSDLITFSYLNQDKNDKTWKVIPGGVVSVTGPELDVKFPTINTTHIRVSWLKFYPDDIVKLNYLFSITELSIQHASSVFESDLISNSLQIQPYQNEQPVIVTTELEVKKQVQPGSSIDFYVGIDEPVAGKVIDQYGNVVDITSDAAVSFVPNGLDGNGKPETYFSFASYLRDNTHINGITAYQHWEPKWQQITPKNETVPSIPNIIYFNTSDFGKIGNDLYYTTPIMWGDVNYTGVYPVTGNDWATNWNGIGLSPKSGYIWGEDPFTNAGVWWGDSSEHAGWWRPNTPTASGTFLQPSIKSTPDFSIPVYSADGNPVSFFNPFINDGNGDKDILRKEFYKIFKWPSNELPIHGTVKLANKRLTTSSDITNNNTKWLWNYSSNTEVVDCVVTFNIPTDANLYTIKLEDIIKYKSDIRIIPDSIRDVKFTAVSPNSIEDYTIEYGIQYNRNNDSSYSRVDLNKITAIDNQYSDTRATIIFADSVIANRRKSGDITPSISLTLSYQARANVITSWDGYLFVPNDVIIPLCYINGAVNNVNSVSIQQVNDNGLVLQTNTIINIASDGSTPIQLYNGLNLVRIFVETSINQNNITDSTIAKWNPNQQIYEAKTPTTVPLITGTYINESFDITTTSYKTNTIYKSGADFITKGVLKGQVIKVNPVYTDNTTKLLVKSKNDMNVIVDTLTSDTITFITNDDVFVGDWSIYAYTMKTGFTSDEGIQSHNGTTYMTEVDINVLLNETNIEDDTKYALIDDVDNSKYLVVKKPHYISFPTDTKSMINNLHFTRTYWDYLSSKFITFTTGTNGNTGSSPNDIITNLPISDRPPNTNANVSYPNITTYGKQVNVIDPGSSGFLFWDTAENLQMVYDITYSIASNGQAADRIFMKAELKATDVNLTPVLNSYSIIINNKQ